MRDQDQNFIQDFHLGLAFAGFLGGPGSLIARKPGTPGHRIWGLGSFLGALLPLFLAQGMQAGVVPTQAEIQQRSLFAAASVVLVLLWMTHNLAARKNKGKVYSRDVGVTWGCRYYRPLVEFVIVMAVAWGVHFASDALAGLLCFSGFANTMSGVVMLKRQQVEIDNANDAVLRGQMFSRDMEHFGR